MKKIHKNIWAEWWYTSYQLYTLKQWRSRSKPHNTFSAGSVPLSAPVSFWNPRVGFLRYCRLPNGELFTPHTSALCGTTGVIYLMLCDCKAFYVGKTIRELRQRIGDHLYYSANGKLTPVGRHIGLYHRFNPLAVKFLALEVVPPDSRGRWPWQGALAARDPLDRET